MRSRPRRPWWSFAWVLKCGVSSLMRAVSRATCTSGLPVSLAARAFALTTSALMEDAIMSFLGRWAHRCTGWAGLAVLTCAGDRKWLPACVLHHAKPADYNPAPIFTPPTPPPQPPGSPGGKGPADAPVGPGGEGLRRAPAPGRPAPATAWPAPENRRALPCEKRHTCRRAQPPPRPPAAPAAGRPACHGSASDGPPPAA